MWLKRLMKVFSDGSPHVERSENDRIAKKVYVGECTDQCVGRGRGGLIP